MFGSHIQRRELRSLALTGASLIALQAMAGTIAVAQEANTPTRRGAANGTSVQLNELSVESQGAGDRYGPVPSNRLGSGQVENPNGPVEGFVAKRSVTALKTNTPLIETPQSISVVGRQQLDAQNAQNLSQATQYVAGTYASPFGYDTRLDYFLLRGFNASDYGLYLNGLQTLNYGFGYFRYDTFGLERVEVLRGPASVLFGAGSPGGIINQVSKRPTADPFGYVEVGGGSYGQKYAAYDFGGPVDKEGHWFYRVTGYGRNGGTQIDGLPDNSYFIAPAVTYKPDGATTFTVLTALQHDTTGVSANFLPYVGSVRAQALGLRIPRSLNVGDPNLNTFHRDQAFLGYQFEHVFDDTWTVRQNMRYSFGDTFQNSYIGNSFTGGLTGPTQTDLPRYQFLVKDRVNIFQVDNQAEARFFDGYFRHDLLMGLDYKDYRLSDNQGTNFGANPFYTVPDLNIVSPTSAPALGTPGPYLVNFNTFKQLGIYLQDQIKLNDQLTLLLGGRQDFADNRINDKLTNGLTSNGRSDNGTTYRLALIYNFDYGLAPYVSYSTSFQPLLGTDINNQGFKPETGKQIEGGVKFEPPGQGYFLTLAGFDIHRRNTLTADPSNPFFQVQLGEVRSTGFEAQLQASVFDGLNVGASYTIYGLTNERNGDPTLIGKVPVNTPENFANVFVDYTIPFGELRGLGFGGGVRYIGRSFADQANLFHVPEYVLFDAQVHYNWDRWRFQVNATNIADRRFVSSCQSVNACFYGQARQVLGSISYRW